mmetsp:Transcript_36499/g.81873  ORF Transcript_36499/g.81873 Transcript_36499/m.81873 type:complete len:271 (-) Transcript_36499:21-833(-)
MAPSKAGSGWVYFLITGLVEVRALGIDDGGPELVHGHIVLETLSRRRGEALVLERRHLHVVVVRSRHNLEHRLPRHLGLARVRPVLGRCRLGLGLGGLVRLRTHRRRGREGVRAELQALQLEDLALDLHVDGLGRVGEVVERPHVLLERLHLGRRGRRRVGREGLLHGFNVQGTAFVFDVLELLPCEPGLLRGHTELLGGFLSGSVGLLGGDTPGHATGPHRLPDHGGEGSDRCEERKEDDSLHVDELVVEVVFGCCGYLCFSFLSCEES